VALRDDMLPVADALRGLFSEFGVARYAVKIRRTTWSGGKPGLGAPTHVDTPIVTASGGNPLVEQLGVREVAGSGGTYRDGDLRIRGITPRYTAPTTGGYTPAMLRIQPAGAAEEVLYVLTGDEGAFDCTFVAGAFDDPVEYSVVVRRRRATP
jgi:hypothetical protein